MNLINMHKMKINKVNVYGKLKGAKIYIKIFLKIRIKSFKMKYNRNITEVKIRKIWPANTAR